MFTTSHPSPTVLQYQLSLISPSTLTFSRPVVDTVRNVLTSPVIVVVFTAPETVIPEPAKTVKSFAASRGTEATTRTSGTKIELNFLIFFKRGDKIYI